MSPSLFQINSMKMADNGVWNLADNQRPSGIDYSDGQDHEQKLLSILSQVQDLRWHSSELEQYCDHWVMQYHLSPQRAQIISAVNLPDTGPVLEIGCGCGAISRYLGDKGYQVEAIEGSSKRAEIARKRCQELDNVQISQANFRHLSLPKKRYAAVLFIGVLEYAGAFAADNCSPEEEVIAILQQVMPSLRDDGVVLIAIENRLGFKYLAGAREDHYGVANIGLYHYPRHDSQLWQRYGGIKTWDQRQWSDIIDTIGGLHTRRYYPFPDYKLPQALLADSFMDNNPYSHVILNRLSSADHRGAWTSVMEEKLFWQSVAQANCLERFSNSFCMVLGTRQAAVDHCLDFHFVRFPSFSRKPDYRQVTRMAATSSTVEKLPWIPNLTYTEESSGPVQQQCSRTDFFAGNLLVDVWCQQLDCYATPGALNEQLSRYWSYLQQLFSDTQDTGKLLDVLPYKIIVDQNDHWHPIDTEWHWKTELEPEFVLFRALLYFAVLEGHRLSFLHLQGITRVIDFIHYAMDHIGITIDQQLEVWNKMEQEFMLQILLPDQIKNISELLQKPLTTAPCTASTTCITVYWSDPDGNFSANNALSQEIDQKAGTIEVNFRLPTAAATARLLRIDPADHRIAQEEALFTIQTILCSFGSGGNQHIALWPTRLTGLEQLSHRSDKPDQNTVLSVTGIDPQLIFNIADIPSKRDASFRLDIKMQWKISKGDQLLNRMLRQENEELGQQLRAKYTVMKNSPR